MTKLLQRLKLEWRWHAPAFVADLFWSLLPLGVCILMRRTGAILDPWLPGSFEIASSLSVLYVAIATVFLALAEPGPHIFARGLGLMLGIVLGAIALDLFGLFEHVP
jgi:hypothetical protein